MHLPPDVLSSTVYRIVILVIVLGGAFRLRQRRHWPVWGCCAFGLASNLLYLDGNLSLAGMFGVPYVGLVAWVLVDFMRNDPHAIRALLGRKEAAWSKERHDLVNDHAACKAQCEALRAQLGAASADG